MSSLDKVKEQNFVKVQSSGWQARSCSPGKCFGLFYLTQKGCQGVQEVHPDLSLLSFPAQRWGKLRMRCRQPREQEGMRHSKPRLSSVFGVDRDGALPRVFPLRKSSPENPDAEPDLTHTKLRAEAPHC